MMYRGTSGRTESDEAADVEAANERENLRRWGSTTAPERVFVRKGDVTECHGPVREDDFTGPLRDIFIAQYGSWAQYRGDKQ